MVVVRREGSMLALWLIGMAQDEVQ
jgi:hypothetical protein